MAQRPHAPHRDIERAYGTARQRPTLRDDMGRFSRYLSTSREQRRTRRAQRAAQKHREMSDARDLYENENNPSRRYHAGPRFL